MKTSEKPTYPVGVSVLITKDDCVLVGERVNTTASGLFSTPGGRIEQQENLYSAACRETLEETGLILRREYLTVLGFREHFRYGMHYFMIYVHATRFEGELQQGLEDKCKEWVWKPIEQLNITNCTEPRCERISSASSRSCTGSSTFHPIMRSRASQRGRCRR